MSNIMFKIASAFNTVCANGVGSAPTSTNQTSETGSIVSGFISGILSWLGNLVTILWGWLMSLVYYVVKLILNLVDLLQYFIQKLAGIDVYKQGLKAIKDFRDGDLIVRLLLSDTVLKLFGAVGVFSVILLIVFTILALVRANYKMAMSADKAEKPADIGKKVAKACLMGILIPILLVIGIFGSNVLLASICNVIKGDNDLTLSGTIFATSAYDANKYRVYAKNGVRIPLVTSLPKGSKIVYPSDYNSEQDMMMLFYDIVMQNVVLGTYKTYNLSESEINELGIGWKDKDAWREEQITSADKIIPSLDGYSNFYSEFKEWYTKYCDSKPLNQHSSWSDIIQAVYKNNWSVNNKYVDTKSSYDFNSTYEVQRSVYFAPTGDSAGIYVNTEEYVSNNHEKFVTTELEYFVMADVLDFMIEHYNEYYFVNADNPAILWNNIVYNDEVVSIEEYNDEYSVFYDEANGKYYTYYGDLKLMSETQSDIDVYKKESEYYIGTTKLTLLSTDSFCVKYYDGNNRLYWSKDDAKSEEDGATYIICTKTENDSFVPLTQTTSKFRSSFLARDYGGPIVARGLFQSNWSLKGALFDCVPTAIKEEYESDSLISLGVDPQSQDNITLNLSVINTPSLSNSSLESYCGTYENLLTTYFGGSSAFNQGELIVTQSDGSTTTINTSQIYINGDVKSVTKKGNNYYLQNKDGEFFKNFSDSLTNTLVGTVEFCYLYYQKYVDLAINHLVMESLNNINSTIAELEEGDGSGKNALNPIIIKFTGKVLDVGGGMYMIVGVEPTGIAQPSMGINDFNTNIMGRYYKYITDIHLSLLSGAGILVKSIYDNLVYKRINGISVYGEHQANLYIDDGQIKSATGDVLLTQKQIKNLYNLSLKEYNIAKVDANGVAADIITSIQSNTTSFEIINGLIGSVIDLSEINFGDSESIKAAIADNSFENKVLSLIYYNNLLIGAGANIIDNTNNTYYSNDNFKNDGSNTTANVNIYNGSGIKVSSLNDAKITTVSKDITVPIILVKSDNLSGEALSNMFIGDTIPSGYDLVNKYNLTVNVNYTYATKENNTYLLKTEFKFTDLTKTYGARDYLTLNSNMVYCFNLNKRITLNAVKNYIADIAKYNNEYFNFTTENGNTGTFSTKEIKQSFNSYNFNNTSGLYIVFYNQAFSKELIQDMSLFGTNDDTGNSSFAFRLHMGNVYQTAINDVYHLSKGSALLDYNFNHSSGIGITYLYSMDKINPLVLIFATGVLFSMLWQMVMGLIQRIFQITVLTILLPTTLAASVFDDNQRFNNWKDKIFEQIFSAYTFLIMLNLYFALIPALSSLTTGLISFEDLPTTITKMFGAIGVNLPVIGNLICAGGLKLTNMVVDVASSPLSIVASDFINRMIYILFFIVLTTLVKQGPDIIGDLIYNKSSDAVGAGKNTIDDVNNNFKQAKNSLPGKMVTGSAELVGNLTKKGWDKFKEGRTRRNTAALSGGAPYNIHTEEHSNDTNITPNISANVSLSPDSVDSLAARLAGNSSLTTHSALNGRSVAGPAFSIGNIDDDSNSESEKGTEKTTKVVTQVVEVESEGGGRGSSGGGGSYYYSSPGSSEPKNPEPIDDKFKGKDGGVDKNDEKPKSATASAEPTKIDFTNLSIQQAEKILQEQSAIINNEHKYLLDIEEEIKNLRDITERAKEQAVSKEEAIKTLEIKRAKQNAELDDLIREHDLILPKKGKQNTNKNAQDAERKRELGEKIEQKKKELGKTDNSIRDVKKYLEGTKLGVATEQEIKEYEAEAKEIRAKLDLAESTGLNAMARMEELKNGATPEAIEKMRKTVEETVRSVEELKGLINKKASTEKTQEALNTIVDKVNKKANAKNTESVASYLEKSINKTKDAVNKKASADKTAEELSKIRKEAASKKGVEKIINDLNKKH